MASGLKNVVNGTLRGVSTKYLQNYANWFRIKSQKLNATEVGQILANNKKAISAHVNREGVYKKFIENFSKRTYRCPVKRSFRSAFNDDAPELMAFI